MSPPRTLLLAFALAAWCLPVVGRAQSCTFRTGPTAIAFGPYNPGAATPTNSSGTFAYDCPNARYRATVQLSTGAGTFTQRQMVFGAERLAYNLYQDAACTIIWGDGTPPSRTLTATRRRTTYTIYGRIPAGQWVAAGTYSDTITITLLY